MSQLRYKLLPNQQQFIKSNHQIQILSVLQKNSLTKLQFISQKNIIWIKSVSDQYKMFRMLIVGLLIKIFYSYSQLNQQRLNKLKDIIYSSKLQSLTKDKAIEKQLVFKNIAINFNSIKVNSSQESQHSLVTIFNNIPFFDETLMQSVAENFQLDYLNTTIQSIEKWFQQNLSLTIVWSDQNPMLQNEKQIYFGNKGQNIVRRSFNCQMEILSQQTQSIKLNSNSRSPTKGTRLKLLKTISAQQFSPSIKKSSSYQKQFEKSSNNSVSAFEPERKQKKKNESFFWKLFCCKQFD